MFASDPVCVCVVTLSISVPQFLYFKTKIAMPPLPSHRNAQGGLHEITGVKVLEHMRNLHKYSALINMSTLATQLDV